jgi:cytoskeleton protein RodZ
MIDFGAKLRAARERRGVSLRQIAETTKISVSALEALERNDPSRLPGGIFSRAFVRSYAAEVGLDPDATVREFLERFDLDSRPLTLEAAAATRVGHGKRIFSNAFLTVIFTTLVLAAIILYLTLARRAADSSSVPAPADHARTSRRINRAGPKASKLPKLS